MAGATGQASTRREVLVILTGLIALTLLAVAISGAGGLFAAPDDPIGPSPTDATVDRTTLVGGGSLGDAERNPIGAGVDGADNPFQNTSAAIQFQVATDTPGYWRVDAYDTYDDGTWVRTGTPTEGAADIPPHGAVTGQLNHTLSLHQDAAALPATWQPASVTTEDPSLAVSPETGLQFRSPAPSASTYDIRTHCYAPDPDQLEAAGTDYPVSIEQRYATLPDDVPGEVRTLSDDIAGDAETPLAATAAIEAWLAENTTYSLETTHDPDSDPVVDFLTTTRAGNAEYYASSTVLLLRAQDIPARYVTGYAPGEALDHADDTYAVRAIHAHAWVEVYVPGHGWIPVDPTPAEERISVESAFVDTDGEMLDVPIAGACPEDDPDTAEEDPPDTDEEDPDTGEEDPPEDNGETDPPDNGADDPPENDTDPDDPIGDTPPGIDLTLSDPTPTPGDSLTVTVTRDDVPVENATVRFNGEHVGQTNASGQLTATVPFADSLEITVTVAEADSLDAMGPPPPGPTAPLAAPGTVTTVDATTNASVTVPIAAQLAVEIDPEPLVLGGDATVTVTVADRPVPDATIHLDDDHVATTDADGTATFTVPPDHGAGPASLTVQRGEITAHQSVTTGALELAAPDRVLALPGQTATVTATAAGQPVAGVDLYHDGDVVATTDDNGTAAVPLAMGTTEIEGSYGEASASVVVDNSLLPLAIGGTAIVAVIGVAGVLARRYRATLERARSRSTRVGRRIGARLHDGLFFLERVARTVATRLAAHEPKSMAIAVLRSPLTGLRWLASIDPRRVAAGIRGLVVGMAMALRVGIARLRGSRGGTADAASTATSTDSDRTASSRSIRQAWAAFVRLVLRRVDSTATPGEVSRRAIDAGLPRGPVTRLLDAFRAAEYGPAADVPSPTAATDALAEIEAETTDPDPDDPTTPDRRSTADP